MQPGPGWVCVNGGWRPPERSDEPGAAVVGLPHGFTRSGLDLCERRLAAPDELTRRMHHDFSRRWLDLRERWLVAAIRRYSDATELELPHDVAWRRVGLRERRLAATRQPGDSSPAAADLELLDDFAGCRLDVRERRLAAARFAFAPNQLPYHIPWSRLDLRQRRLAPVVVATPADRVINRLSYSVPGCGLDVRERRLAATRFAITPVDLPDRPAGRWVGVRKRRLAAT